MGRGRGKGKKQAIIAANGVPDHAEEEKLPTSNRRGRPQKPLKDEVLKKEEAEKIEDDENIKSSTTSKASTDSGIRKKRKRATSVKEDSDPVKEAENGSGAQHSSDSNVKSVGFRPNGSRRKSKPCRAAEVGVKCK